MSAQNFQIYIPQEIYQPKSIPVVLQKSMDQYNYPQLTSYMMNGPTGMGAYTGGLGPVALAGANNLSISMINNVSLRNYEHDQVL